MKLIGVGVDCPTAKQAVLRDTRVYQSLKIERRRNHS